MAVHVISISDVIWTTLLFLLPVLLWQRLMTLQTRKPPATRSVTIVVLGDIGRSPRMMYHAESFSRAGFDTLIVGYKGTSPPPSLLSAPGIQFFHLKAPPHLPRSLFLLLAPIKVLFQVVSLSYAVLVGRSIHRPPQYILVQNPPSIPTLAIVQFASWLRGSKLIIDWHNLGYSILALRLGENHVLVKVAKWFERVFGRRAYAHLFVTKAMKEELEREWKLEGKKLTLHDRPPNRFHAASATETHDLFLRLPSFLPDIANFLPPFELPKSTSRTQLVSPTLLDGFQASSDLVATLRADRPALVVSSTSWTADEDFGILIHALQSYERKAGARNASGVKGSFNLPKLLMIVTGKGPLRDFYMDQILMLEKEEKWEYVRCRSLWLKAADYPIFLGSADLGISLHSSSSSLDLPMKVVDMFGCGLPVCALDFACLDELVKDGRNGLIFRNADELAEHLDRLLSGFPQSNDLRKLKDYFQGTPSKKSTGWCSWEENWDAIVRPLVDLDSVGPRNRLS